MEIHKDFLDKKDIDKIIKSLSVSIKADYGNNCKVYNVYEHDQRSNTYNLPLHWANSNLTFKVKPKFKQLPLVNPGRFNIIPRKHQEDCMKECLKEFKKDWGGGIINMATGSGKSLQAMMLFHHLKQKTLVIVHTVELMQQWIKSIGHFLPDVKVGKIQGQLFDIHEKNIVVGMLQTISMKAEYTKDFFSDFGLVIYDEVQFLSAEVFSKALLKSRSRYVFGLSATVERKDGLQWIFKAHIGDIIYSNINTCLKQYTELKFIFVDTERKEKIMYNGTPNISGMITDISEDLQRTQMLCKELKNLPDSRKVLVLSERVEHLKEMNRILGDQISGIFIGKMKQQDKEFSKTKKILLATYHIASVGFDHPVLNTIMFATPRSNITQAIGRIYRQLHDITPLIIDVVDNYSIFPYQFKKRKLAYSKNIKQQEEVIDCLFD